uniref:Major facilitator superfamily (MFS) profile domain-containing protein n=1 Tax=Zooxanthella nutricula TaxID=1333877 RepID=A0A7S2Q405_9DINO
MGVGAALAPLVVLLCLQAGCSPDFTWRFGFGFGAMVSLLNMVLRLLLVEDSEGFKAQQVHNEKEGWRRSATKLRKYSRLLVGTCGAWFLYDTVDYGLALCSSTLAEESVGTDSKQTAASLLLYALMALPGCYAAAIALPCLGRKPAYILGISCMMVVFLVLAAFYDQIVHSPMLYNFIFGLQMFFNNAGPSASTFVIPGEVFPTAVRATAVGLSAASGKLGAVAGVYGIGMLQGSVGARGVFAAIVLVCLGTVLFAGAFLPNYDDRALARLEEVDKRGSQVELYALLYGGGAVGRCELAKPRLHDDPLADRA